MWYAPKLPHDPPADLVEHYRTKTDSIHVARYWGNVERFDRTVGDLLDHLDHTGLAADTLVVYVTDNGWIQNPTTPRFAPRSKLSPYDGGLRTPIMLRRPGTIQPRESTVLASAIDIVPTVLAACGPSWKLIVPAARPMPEAEARNVDLESRRRHGAGEVELLDVAADPDETRNVAAEHPAVVRELRDGLDRVWRPEGVPAPGALLPAEYRRALSEVEGTVPERCHRTPAPARFRRGIARPAPSRICPSMRR